jgi:acetyl-CoA carboxylase carboxyl transferase subunit alpha
MTNYLEFERPLAEIEGKAEELRAMGRDNEDMDVDSEAKALDKKASDMLGELYEKLTPWRGPPCRPATLQRLHSRTFSGIHPSCW